MYSDSLMPAITPLASVATQYTYLTTDLVTNTILGELPVSGVSMDCQLNTAGHMQCGGNLGDPSLNDNEWLARTTPGRTAFWAYRNNQIVWGGIILSREYQSNGLAITLTGQTFECYPANRFPRYVIGTATQVLNQGQCSLINYLWQQLQSVTGGNIGVVQAPNIPANDTIAQMTTSKTCQPWLSFSVTLGSRRPVNLDRSKIG